MWLQDTVREMDVLYCLIKKRKATGDMFVLTKRKRNIKDIPCRFCPDSKELPRIRELVKGESKLLPHVFSQKPLALQHPLSQSHNHKGK